MNEPFPDEALQRICRLACEAGDVIQSKRHVAQDADVKADGSPVTAADLAAHDLIARALEDVSPRAPVISEEGDLSAVNDPPRLFWLVDPLDGTKDYVQGFPDYTVNIALVEDGEVLAGVIRAPAQRTTYWAVRGNGAWKAQDGSETKPLRPRGGQGPFVAAVSRSHLDSRTRHLLQLLGVDQMIQRGSSIKMCAVAEGEADIYPRLAPTSVWDTAAGAAVAREAGCAVLAPDGTDISYDLSDGVLREAFIVCGGESSLIDKLRGIDWASL